MRSPIKGAGGQQKEPTKRKAGRPIKEMDLAMVKQLAAINCTDEEIAAVMEVSVDTIARRKKSDPAFVEAMEMGRGQGRASIRRQQYQVAMKGHPAMLIWLGKQWLGQRDKFEEAAEESNQPLPWVD